MVTQTTVVVTTTVEVDATGNVSSIANRSAVVTVVQNTPGGIQTASGAQAIGSVNTSQVNSGLQNVTNAVAQFKQTTGISPVQAQAQANEQNASMTGIISLGTSGISFASQFIPHPLARSISLVTGAVSLTTGVASFSFEKNPEKIRIKAQP